MVELTVCYLMQFPLQQKTMIMFAFKLYFLRILVKNCLSSATWVFCLQNSVKGSVCT